MTTTQQPALSQPAPITRQPSRRISTQDLAHAFALRLIRTKPGFICGWIEWMLETLDVYSSDRGADAERIYDGVLRSLAADIEYRLETGQW
jgi:hypothetical protein